MSAAPSGRFTTRSAIEDLTTSDFADAAARWRSDADQSDDVFDRHRQNIAIPGGTTWEGDAKDAALDRATADRVVAGNQSRVVREAADIAEKAVTDIVAARREALDAITAAQDDGFTVGENLFVTDARRYNINTVIERNTAAREHAEDIRWYAGRLGQTVAFAEGRLQTKAGELEGIRFDGEGENGRKEPDGEPTVCLVDNKVVHDTPDEGHEDETGDEPVEQATGQIGPFGVPQAVEDAAKNPDAKPEDKRDTSDVGGDLGDLLGAEGEAEGEPEDGAAPEAGGENPAGLPPVLSQVPPPPDKAAIDRQAAKVEASRQNLADVQAKLDNDAAVGDYTQGAGAGPGRDVSEPLSQAVFNARAELTEQTRILNELNYASAAAGGPTAPVAPLPENSHVQAFPPPPSEATKAAEGLAEFHRDLVDIGIVPDVVNMYDVATNWDEATAAERTQAGLDAAGMAPLPFGKPIAEGFEHGLDALTGTARHLDDAPTPHVDPSPAPHTDMGSGGHVDPPAVDAPAPPQHSITPDTLDPYQGLQYTSDDPHHPGGWPPGTPEATWTKGDTDPGWHHVNRGDDRPWMPYQEQISGADRLSDGRIPEYAQINPDTGKPVNFDGHTMRGDQEVFLDAKDGYSALATDAGKPWADGMADGLLTEVEKQLRALPDKAILEIHVSDPAGAAAIRRLIEANDLFGPTVIYTPKAP